jgi:hypothetical protein
MASVPKPQRGDIRMSRTFSQLFSHLVFSTKQRARLIVPDLKPELHAYLGGLTRELQGKALAINGMENHVHLGTGGLAAQAWDRLRRAISLGLKILCRPRSGL